MSTLSHKLAHTSKPVLSLKNILIALNPPSHFPSRCLHSRAACLTICRKLSSIQSINELRNSQIYNFDAINYKCRHDWLKCSQIPSVVISIRPCTSFPLKEPVAPEKKETEEEISLTATQKFVNSLPIRYHPYLKLSRVDRPIGTWLLFWPSTWGLTAAAGGMPDWTLLALFGAGAFIMRGAGCTVNDMWDRHIDPLVRRTSSRPLASGQLRMRHATAWLGVQLSFAFGILSLLNPSCFLISCGALGLVCLYPLAKRVTYWPQAVLGLTFNTGALIGYAAAHPTATGFFEAPYIDPVCLSLYASGIIWTLIYDTIYAHQDLQDDTLLGLGSTARRFGDNTKLWLSGFSTLMISSLTMAGIAADLAWPYYVGLSGVSAHLIWQIATLNIRDASNCGERFTSNRHIGWIILISMLTSYWMKENQNKYSAKSVVDVKDSLAVPKYAAGLTSSSA